MEMGVALFTKNGEGNIFDFDLIMYSKTDVWDSGKLLRIEQYPGRSFIMM